MQKRGLPSVARRSTRSVTIQPLEIEHPRSESEHPDLDGAWHDVRAVRDARQRGLIGERLSDRIQNHVHAGDLARQCLEWQHALAMPAVTTTCERHLEHHGCVGEI